MRVLQRGVSVPPTPQFVWCSEVDQCGVRTSAHVSPNLITVSRTFGATRLTCPVRLRRRLTVALVAAGWPNPFGRTDLSVTVAEPITFGPRFAL